MIKELSCLAYVRIQQKKDCAALMQTDLEPEVTSFVQQREYKDKGKNRTKKLTTKSVNNLQLGEEKA